MSLSKWKLKVSVLRNREEGRDRIIAGWKDKGEIVLRNREEGRDHIIAGWKDIGEIVLRNREEGKDRIIAGWKDKGEIVLRNCEEGRDRKGFAVSRKEFKVKLNRLRQSAERRVLQLIRF